jgi:hypothetical protein
MTRIFANFQLPHKFLLLKNSYTKRVSNLKHAYSCKIASNKTQVSISNKYYFSKNPNSKPKMKGIFN